MKKLIFMLIALLALPSMTLAAKGGNKPPSFDAEAAVEEIKIELCNLYGHTGTPLPLLCVVPALDSSSSYLFNNLIVFGTNPYNVNDLSQLSEGGQSILADGSSGGSSLYSKVFSFEILSRWFGAQLLKTETEISYDDSTGKISHFIIDISGFKVGVIVTRAFTLPLGEDYTEEAAHSLLFNKLGDVILSTANVSAVDLWKKQILHIFADTVQHAERLKTVYNTLPEDLRSDTILVITVTEGDDIFLY